MTGGFPATGSHQHLGAGTSVTMGPACCFVGVDVLTAATLQLPADTRIRPAQAPAGGPRSLQSHPSSLLCATKSLVLRDCSPLQREPFGVHFWLFWFLDVLGKRKGYGATYMTPTPRKEPTGRKGQLCVCSSEGTETLSFDNR